jgi:hypothetical protein
LRSNRKRLAHSQTDAIDPSRTFATVNCRIAKGLFDHLVGGGEQLRWYGDAERFWGLEVDDQLERGRLKDRQIGGLCALKDLAGVGTRMAIGAGEARAVADRGARGDELAEWVDRGSL